MNTVCRSVVLPVLAACLVVPHAVAQLSIATINGVVRDATGSVIPDAELVLTFGNMGRSLLRSDGRINWDLSVFQAFPFFREGMRAEFRAEAFNAFNQTAYGVPTANLNNSNFGRVTGQANSPRQLQLGIKILF